MLQQCLRFLGERWGCETVEQDGQCEVCRASNVTSGVPMQRIQQHMRRDGACSAWTSEVTILASELDQFFWDPMPTDSSLVNKNKPMVSLKGFIQSTIAFCLLTLSMFLEKTRRST